MEQYNMWSVVERIVLFMAIFILVVVDYSMKWVEAYVIPRQEATTVADVLIRKCIMLLGVSLELRSEQGLRERTIPQDVW